MLLQYSGSSLQGNSRKEKIKGKGGPKMGRKLVRLSLSIEEALYKKLEKLVRDNGYSNRSEFVRDMIRERLVADEWAIGDEVQGTITLVYDHNKRELNERLMDAEHQFYENVLASTHKHLNEYLCAEMIMVKGDPDIIKDLYNGLRKQRGVLHSGLTTSSTGEKLN
jgi:CopG family nickel-responsive transcriptional regulator